MDNSPQMFICVFQLFLFLFFFFTANTSHISRVCSTWGNYHWKTFDGHFYQLDSLCNHVLVSECTNGYESLNIQMRRSLVKDIPKISTIVFVIDGSVVEISSSAVTVNKNTYVFRIIFPFLLEKRYFDSVLDTCCTCWVCIDAKHLCVVGLLIWFRVFFVCVCEKSH